jgi:hypothetical protein
VRKEAAGNGGFFPFWHNHFFWLQCAGGFSGPVALAIQPLWITAR